MNADGDSVDAGANQLDEAAAAIRSALSGDSASNLAGLPDPSVTWGDCAGAEAVLEFVSAILGADTALSRLDVDVVGDRP